MFNNNIIAEQISDEYKVTPLPRLAISNDNVHPFRILLVEDLLTDARLVQRALHDCKFPHELVILSKGEEVLPYLKQAQQHAVFPSMIMLDLGLPGATGFDVLEELSHEQAAVRSVPITILTGLQNFNYIVGTFNKKLAIVSYLEKPCDPIALQDTLARTCGLYSDYNDGNV